MNYKLLKDLPGLKAGAVFKYSQAGLGYRDADGIYSYSREDIEANPDFFKPITEKKFGEIERADHRKPYCRVDDRGDVITAIETNWQIDHECFQFGNYFHTEAEAQERADWIKAALKIWRWCEDANKTVEGGRTYFMVIVCEDGLEVEERHRIFTHKASPFYLNSQALAEQSIKELEEEWKVFLRVGK